MLTGTDSHPYDVEEIGELLAELGLLIDQRADCLAIAEAAAERLAPGERDLVGVLLEDLAAVVERHADRPAAA